MSTLHPNGLQTARACYSAPADRWYYPADGIALPPGYAVVGVNHYCPVCRAIIKHEPVESTHVP